MKKKITFIMLCFVFGISYSQNTFLNTVNHFKNIGALEPPSSYYNNLNAALVDRSYELEAILVMYKETNNPYWLRLFVKHADKVINARDDKQIGSTPIENYLGNIEPTWVSNHQEYSLGYKYAWVYHSGMLTYPLAEFCYIISQNQSYFQNVFANNTGGTFYTNQSLLTIANDLKTKIGETLNAHEDEWANRSLPNSAIGGGYNFDCNLLAYNGFLKPKGLMAGGTIPLNMQAAIGKTFLYMFLASPFNDPLKNYFKERTIRIANTLRYNMTSQTPSGSSHYVWRYWDVWDHPSSGNYTNSCVINFNPYDLYYTGNDYEDWGHSIVDVSFAYLCYKNSLPFNMSTSSLCFDLSDMHKLSATFKNIYYDPMKYYFNVNRQGALNYPTYNFSYPSDLSGIGHWLMFSEFDKDIYQMISEVYTKYSLNKVLPSWPGFLGITNSYKYRNKFNPIDVGEGGASSIWAGVAIGDFNNDGVKDVAAARNFDGSVFLYKWDFIANLNRNGLTQNQVITNGSSSQWRGVAIGDLDGQPGDELAAIRNFDNTVYIWKNTGSSGSINLTFWKSIYVGSATNWAGIAIGNFDNSDNSKEIAVLSNSTGYTYIYDYNGSNFFLKSTLQSGSASQWAGITAGNFDNDTRDEIVQVRNFDGDIYLYKLNSSNVIVPVGQKYDAPSNMDWAGITAGDYDMDGKAEICAHARSDGDLYFYKFNGTAIVSFDREYFTGPVSGRNLENNYLASGNLTNNSGCCVKDEIINFRNSDGWNYIYELNIGGICYELCDHVNKRFNIKDEANKNITIENGFTVYPNPINDELNIAFNSVQEGIGEIAIYNSLGSLVKLSKIDFTAMENSLVTLNLEELSNGIYIIIISNNSFSETNKIIISK